MKKKVTILGFICMALILAALPFMAACGEPEPLPAPAAPTVINPTEAVTSPVTTQTPPAPAAPATPVTPAPAGPATPVTPAPAPVVVPAPSGEPMFTVLDPRGTVTPIPYVGLAPRLDTLEGKRIGVVNMMGGNEAVMDSLPADIMAAHPECTAELLYMKDSKGDAEWAFINGCDAIVLGHNY